MNYNKIPKKILIDTTFLFDQFSKRGIGRYGKEILKRLIDIILEDSDFELHFIGFLDLPQNLIQLELSSFRIEGLNSRILFHSLGEPVLSGINNIQSWIYKYVPIIKNLNPDIYFAPHFERGLPSTSFINMGLTHRPLTIIMANDAIPLITNKYSSKGFLQNILKGIFYRLMFTGIQNAEIVLTISNFSKNDLIKYGKVNDKKIHTIYLGVDENFFQSQNTFFKENKNIEEINNPINKILEGYGVKNENYFLYDSGLEENKGINELLKVFKYISEQNNKNLPNKLVIIGGDFTKNKGTKIKAKTHLGKKYLNQFNQLNIIDNIITTDKVSNIDLEILLFNSKVYLNFSKYEGFSLGPVQAMAAGIPAAVLNASCIEEITQDGVFLINLDETHIMAESIIKFLSDTKLVQEKIEKGYTIAKKYNWDKTAEQTWNVIKGLQI